MLSLVKTSLLSASLFSMLASGLSLEFQNQLSSDYSDRYDRKRKSVSRVRRMQEEECLEVAVLGSDENIADILEAVNIVNENDCGTSLCFDPDTGSITTQNEADIVSNLGNFDALIIINGDQFRPPLTPDAKTDVERALSSGVLKKVMVYDRYAGFNSILLGTDVNMPGLNDGDVVRMDGEGQNPITAGSPPVTGPAGSIGFFSASPSARGYIDPTAEILSEQRTEQHYTRTDNGETTTIQYCYSSSVVYYSTIPMDLFLVDGSAFGVFSDIFVNALCHLASSECTAPSRCRRWLFRCDVDDDCCLGNCRGGRCRLFA